MHHIQIFVFNSIFRLNKFCDYLSPNKFILCLKENYFFMMAKMRNFANKIRRDVVFAKNFQLLPFRENFREHLFTIYLSCKKIV